MRDEFGFEVGPSEIYKDRLEELLDRLELQESGAYESALSAEQLEGAPCPGPVRETVSRFSRYKNSIAALPATERAKLAKIAGLIVTSFRGGCQRIIVRLVGHADRDLAKERRQPGFLASISRQRALAVRQALERLINDRTISSRIDWDVTGVGASSLVVPDPENKPESLRALNRRVEMFVQTGIVPQPPVPPATLTQDFRIVAKSFINTILPRVGFTRCFPLDPGSEARLAALAAATQAATGENPFTDAKDKIYRLFSARTFTVTCANGGLVSVIPSAIDTDVGVECVPTSRLCLTPPPVLVSGISAGPSGSSTFDFAWAVKGRPHPAAEPGFQLVCPRTSVFIWHAIQGQIACTSSGVTVTTRLAGSQFPSHRVWVNGAVRATIPQGDFSQLWLSSPVDATQVA